jgi:hypothetical protein
VTRRLVVLAGVLFVATTSAGVAFRVGPPDASTLAAHVIALTAPEMEGRESGTVGAERAARYIVDRLAAGGLRPGGEGAMGPSGGASGGSGGAGRMRLGLDPLAISCRGSELRP